MPMHDDRGRSTYYGKGDVTVYRTYARPLVGITSIPESGFVGRSGLLFATNVTVLVTGEEFVPAYTEADNGRVVPTDTMKNFIQRQAASYEGATLEGLLDFLGRQFLATYPQMQTVELIGHEVPFTPVAGQLFRQSHGEAATAAVHLLRTAGRLLVTDDRSGLEGLQLVKLSGNAFAGFARDAYTTLPEAQDRALFVWLDMGWRYSHPLDALGEEPSRYVAAEQVRDVAQAVFADMYTQSIQHLIYAIGRRVLERFPQLAEIRFEAQNRTWETVAGGQALDARVQVYTDPRPPYGIVGLTLRREELPPGGH